jgi:hypothetical protein
MDKNNFILLHYMKLPQSMTTVTTFTKILAMIFFVALPFIGFYVGKLYYEGLCPENTFEIIDLGSTDGDGDEDAEVTDEEDGSGTTASDPYTLTLGDNSIEVPAGWYVSEIVADYEVSPDRMLDLLTTSPLSDGWYPIYQESSFTLTNGTSSMTVFDRQDIVGGAWGANLESMDPGYTVIDEPTADVEGFARKETGGKYEYITVYFCSDPVFCEDYAVVAGEPFSRGGTFFGDASDFDTADQIYRDTILGENFPAVVE